MSPDDYVRIQLRLECIGYDPEGRLVRIPGPDPDDLGRVYVYHHEGGYRLFVRSDVPDADYAALRELGAEAAFENAGAVQAVLARERPCDDVARWRTYRLVTPDPATSSGVIVLSEAHRQLLDAYAPGMTLGKRPIYAAVATTPEGKDAICATCVSVRENEEAAESYVFTDPAWRRQGYGRRVTAAWAEGALARGKVPFYSYLVDNVASSQLLQSLPSVYCFEGVVYS